MRKQRLLWTVLVINVPTRLLSLGEALQIGRARWPIELLFKLWKSQGRIDESTGAKLHRVLCELYAKLVAMIVQRFRLTVAHGSRIDRSVHITLAPKHGMPMHLARQDGRFAASAVSGNVHEMVNLSRADATTRPATIPITSGQAAPLRKRRAA